MRCLDILARSGTCSWHGLCCITSVNYRGSPVSHPLHGLNLFIAVSFPSVPPPPPRLPKPPRYRSALHSPHPCSHHIASATVFCLPAIECHHEPFRSLNSPLAASTKLMPPLPLPSPSSCRQGGAEKPPPMSTTLILSVPPPFLTPPPPPPSIAAAVSNTRRAAAMARVKADASAAALPT